MASRRRSTRDPKPFCGMKSAVPSPLGASSTSQFNAASWSVSGVISPQGHGTRASVTGENVPSSRDRCACWSRHRCLWPALDRILTLASTHVRVLHHQGHLTVLRLAPTVRAITRSAVPCGLSITALLASSARVRQHPRRRRLCARGDLDHGLSVRGSAWQSAAARRFRLAAWRALVTARAIVPTRRAHVRLGIHGHPTPSLGMPRKFVSMVPFPFS
jgi:hypothetical protein